VAKSKHPGRERRAARRRSFAELEIAAAEAEAMEDGDDDFEADWSTECSQCGQVPTVAGTGMCGPCTFGEADTIDGNW
jgi:hypothetical protein